MATQIENMRLRQNFRNVWDTALITTNLDHIRYTHVVLVTCPAVVTVKKPDILNSALLRSRLRLPAVLQTQWLQLDICYKMNLTFKLRSVIVALLVSFLWAQQLACVFSMIGSIVGNKRPLQKASQTQRKLELDNRDEKFGSQPMDAPRPQQMSIFNSSLPPLYAPS
ncbi:hypothetical protein VNO80_08741 [Phaseolus coccineus]|uniref:Uncharacterized protein n=1 Tax=Phaseolus coccineus TaxID=3886 RepID=A0AAN9NAB3_PHACN